MVLSWSDAGLCFAFSIRKSAFAERVLKEIPCERKFSSVLFWSGTVPVPSYPGSSFLRDP